MLKTKMKTTKMVRFQAFTVETVMMPVFWDIAP
jgi:hypothetical protein